MNFPAQLSERQDPRFVPMHDQGGEEEGLNLIEYWRSVTKRKWAILALAVVVAGLAAAIAYSLPPVYRSSTSLMLEQGKPKILSIEEVYAGSSQNREHYQTQIEILKSREVALKTIARLQLWNYPEFDPRRPDESWVGRLKAGLGMGGGAAEREWDEGQLARAVYGAFAARLGVDPVRNSQMLRLSFDTEDPQLAALVVNTHATVFIESDRDARFAMTQSANAWLQERTVELREKLNASERALQAFRESQGIVNLQGSTHTVIGQQVGEFTQRLIEARVRRTELESAYQQVKSVTDGDYSLVPAIARNPQVASAKDKVSAARAKVAELAERYGSEHPRMLQAQAELKAAQDNLERQSTVAVGALTREYELARSTERAIESGLASARGAVQGLNRNEAQLAILEREVQSNRQLYDLFIERTKEMTMVGDLQGSIARVIDPAVAPGGQIKPKKNQIILIALVLGLFGGVVIAIVLDKLDNTIKGTEDAESRLHQPLLAALPLLNQEERSHVIRLFIDKPDSLYAESIRTARTGVLLSNIDLSHRVLMVTSSVPGEGKTTLCTNLALAHAHTKKTLLIDADMRRPQVGRNLDLAPGTKGLSNLVAGTASVEECVHPVQGSTLMLLPAGDVPPNPLELLLSQRFRETLAKLQEEYEVILIDSPPVELVSDALVLAPMADSVIYVVRAMETPYPLARKGLTRLQRAGGKVLGVVLNQMDFERAQKYYGEYSGYSQYGYNSYGYSSSSHKS